LKETRIVTFALKAELERYKRMIEVSIETVKNGIRRGLKLSQTQKVGLPIEWEPFSHGYRTDQWLEAVYQSLNKKAK